MSKLAHLKAEWIKLKRTPVLYLPLFLGILMGAFVFIGHYGDGNSLAVINQNPWRVYFGRGGGIYSIFLLIPFVVLLTGGIVFIERRANAWKYLYTMPLTRGRIYFAKLLILLGLLAMASVLFMLCIIVSAYFLGWFFPEHEFYYYAPQIKRIANYIVHSYIAILGVLGLHYLLSLYFKNVLIPFGIGMLGMVMGFFFVGLDVWFNIYFPYAAPMAAQDFGMFRSTQRAFVGGNWLSNYEMYSLIWFIVTVEIGYLYETRREVV